MILRDGTVKNVEPARVLGDHAANFTAGVQHNLKEEESIPMQLVVSAIDAQRSLRFNHFAPTALESLFSSYASHV